MIDGLTIQASVTIKPPEPLLNRPIPQGGSFIASGEELKAWLLDAETSARCIYARAAHLPNGCAVGAVARELAAGGFVTLTRGRFAPASPLFEFVAKRTSFPLAPDMAPAPDDDVLHPDERRLLEVLAGVADRGEPCPPNRALARLALLNDGDQASYRLRCLRDKGAVLVKPVPVEPLRVVTIVATGARTGLAR